MKERTAVKRDPLPIDWWVAANFETEGDVRCKFRRAVEGGVYTRQAVISVLGRRRQGSESISAHPSLRGQRAAQTSHWLLLSLETAQRSRALVAPESSEQPPGGDALGAHRQRSDQRRRFTEITSGWW